MANVVVTDTLVVLSDCAVCLFFGNVPSPEYCGDCKKHWLAQCIHTSDSVGCEHNFNCDLCSFYNNCIK